MPFVNSAELAAVHEQRAVRHVVLAEHHQRQGAARSHRWRQLQRHLQSRHRRRLRCASIASATASFGQNCRHPRICGEYSILENVQIEHNSRQVDCDIASSIATTPVERERDSVGKSILRLGLEVEHRGKSEGVHTAHRLEELVLKHLICEHWVDLIWWRQVIVNNGLCTMSLHHQLPSLSHLLIRACVINCAYTHCNKLRICTGCMIGIDYSTMYCTRTIFRDFVLTDKSMPFGGIEYCITYIHYPVRQSVQSISESPKYEYIKYQSRDPITNNRNQKSRNDGADPSH